jgi:sulfoxide reductase heme-binding subunit YedZ
MTLRFRFSKLAVFLLCFVPIAYLAFAALTDKLSANPIEDITVETGLWALRFLLLTLCVTPFRRLTGWNEVIRYRRMLGLYAFFYGFLHFLTYAWLDQFLSIPDIVQDVYKRPFIAAGFSAFVLMIPLAITSTKKWIARLGGRRWRLLHRLTYVGAIAGVVHYLWLVKADTQRPLVYGFLLSILLGFRVLILTSAWLGQNAYAHPTPSAALTTYRPARHHRFLRSKVDVDLGQSGGSGETTHGSPAGRRQ